MSFYSSATNLVPGDTNGDPDVFVHETISADPFPDITANGSDGPVTIPSSDNLSIEIGLDSAGRTDNADWWVLTATPFAPPNDWYYYNLSDWVPGFSVTYQAPLFDLSPYEVLNMSGLPVGSYTFYFGVDLIMNGSLDMGQIYYDSVEVEVTP
ncbi:MAG: hypothetical protein GY774_34740 [Planctomycetes bacterium]|nr:hypothetical protein [Planctomycetota bacterium]